MLSKSLVFEFVNNGRCPYFLGGGKISKVLDRMTGQKGMGGLRVTIEDYELRFRLF